MVTRVNGGLITDQMLTGSLRHFKMVGNFNYVVSDGEVMVGVDPGKRVRIVTTFKSNVDAVDDDGLPITIDDLILYFEVSDGKPVPGSLAELAIRQVMEKCNVVELGIVGTPGSETEVHFSVSATGCAWEDAAEIQAAIALLGATVTVPSVYTDPVLVGGAIRGTDHLTRSVDATAITVTEVPFVLA